MTSERTVDDATFTNQQMRFSCGVTAEGWRHTQQ